MGAGTTVGKATRTDATITYTSRCFPSANGCGSVYLCTSHDEVVAGTKPTRP
jgi:hypothetical protein